MGQYLLALHSGGEPSHGPSMTPEEMQGFMARIEALEADMRDAGVFVFTGGLHGADAATVVRSHDGEISMTDGPYVESKEHIAGFYVVEAEDLDTAVVWAGKVVDTVGAPIEVRPFFDTRTV